MRIRSARRAACRTFKSLGSTRRLRQECEECAREWMRFKSARRAAREAKTTNPWRPSRRRAEPPRTPPSETTLTLARENADPAPTRCTANSAAAVSSRFAVGVNSVGSTGNLRQESRGVRAGMDADEACGTCGAQRLQVTGLDRKTSPRVARRALEIGCGSGERRQGVLWAAARGGCR